MTSPVIEARGLVKTFGDFVAVDDVSLAIQEELHREFGFDGFAPAQTLRDKVDSGALGRKTGEGFHTY